MPKYEFWYEESYTYKGWFEADNLEHANELLDQMEAGELELEELPNSGSKDKNYEFNATRPREIKED